MRWDKVYNVVGCHAAGMVGDVVVGGVPSVPGETVFEKMQYFQRNLDHIRRTLMYEPRTVSGLNFVVPAGDPEAAYGYIIAEPIEYVAMSGSNTLCVATVLLETGMVPMVEPVTELTLEAPAGLIRLRCECRDGKVTNVSFLNQPSFVYHHQAPVEVAGSGTIPVDVAWGGMTYAIVDAEALGFRLTEDEARDLVALGQRIKAAAAEQLPVVHPLEPRHHGITQTEFAGPLRMVDSVLTSRNAVVISPGVVDRSPCGTGTSARLALLHAQGELEIGQPFVHESILGTRFTAEVESTTTVGAYPAVSPRVGGQAWINSTMQVGVDPTDPFPEGYMLGDKFVDDIDSLSLIPPSPPPVPTTMGKEDGPCE
ncbi:proline racemase family protein [Actinomadura madurae]|uniref:Proline racemase n=1 Tax=Actinomadura madurae TaxID=1993 RepID=A0A1I5I5I7_9ACTN|nr:proline racemase family protein [Actinomadura madurae]SFO55823.1 proline racemase [Actinomadura madurae]